MDLGGDLRLLGDREEARAVARVVVRVEEAGVRRGSPPARRARSGPRARGRAPAACRTRCRRCRSARRRSSCPRRRAHRCLRRLSHRSPNRHARRSRAPGRCAGQAATSARGIGNDAAAAQRSVRPLPPHRQPRGHRCRNRPPTNLGHRFPVSRRSLRRMRGAALPRCMLPLRTRPRSIPVTQVPDSASPTDAPRGDRFTYERHSNARKTTVRERLLGGSRRKTPTWALTQRVFSTVIQRTYLPLGACPVG